MLEYLREAFLGFEFKVSQTLCRLLSSWENQNVLVFIFNFPCIDYNLASPRSAVLTCLPRFRSPGSSNSALLSRLRRPFPSTHHSQLWVISPRGSVAIYLKVTPQTATPARLSLSSDLVIDHPQPHTSPAFLLPGPSVVPALVKDFTIHLVKSAPGNHSSNVYSKHLLGISYILSRILGGSIGQSIEMNR